jgi:hypothetical protein
MEVAMLIETVLTFLFLVFGLWAFTQIIKAYHIHLSPLQFRAIVLAAIVLAYFAYHLWW